jgi:hypothetical protein
MNKIYFEVNDDVVIKNTPMPEVGKIIYKTEVVITKEIFQECYKKWIEPKEVMMNDIIDNNTCI